MLRAIGRDLHIDRAIYDWYLLTGNWQLAHV